MKRTKSTTHFTIAPTEYGWALRAGSSQLGLFVTQKHAIANAKIRQRSLRAQGSKSDLTIVGQEVAPAHSRMRPNFRGR